MISIRKELRDQAAHFGAGLVFALPLAIDVNPLTGIIATGGYGLVREVTEEGAPVTLAKVRAALRSWKDLLGWSLPGLLIGLFV